MPTTTRLRAKHSASADDGILRTSNADDDAPTTSTTSNAKMKGDSDRNDDERGDNERIDDKKGVDRDAMTTSALMLLVVASGVVYSVVFSVVRASPGVVALVNALVALGATLHARRQRHTGLAQQQGDQRSQSTVLAQPHFEATRAALASALYCVSTLVPTLIARHGLLSYAATTFARLASLAFAIALDVRDALRANARAREIDNARELRDALLKRRETVVAAVLLLATIARGTWMAALTAPWFATSGVLVASAAAALLGELQRHEAPALASTSDETLVMYSANALIAAGVFAYEGLSISGTEHVWHGWVALAVAALAQHVCVARVLDDRRRAASTLPVALAARKLVTYALFEYDRTTLFVGIVCTVALIRV